MGRPLHAVQGALLDTDDFIVSETLQIPPALDEKPCSFVGVPAAANMHSLACVMCPLFLGLASTFSDYSYLCSASHCVALP
jgi:hypothetical protein